MRRNVRIQCNKNYSDHLDNVQQSIDLYNYLFFIYESSPFLKILWSFKFVSQVACTCGSYFSMISIVSLLRWSAIRIFSSARSKKFHERFTFGVWGLIPSYSFSGKTSCFREPIWMISTLIDAFQIIACTGNHRLMKIFDALFSNLFIVVKIYGSSCEMDVDGISLSRKQ